MAIRIDGKVIAAKMRAQLANEIETLKHKHGITPGLAVVLVGNDPASEVYVASKGKMCRELGMHSSDIRLPAATKQEELLATIVALNKEPSVNGILVQLRLPKHIDSNVIINAIDPAKDVDGFHVVNVGKLSIGLEDGMVPCTSMGCMMLIQSVPDNNLAGKHAVIIGRSNIVGKPIAQLLLRENCTVTIAHSRTKELPALCRQADILVAAVGQPEMVKGEWVKEDAIVIDVGINRVTLSDGSQKLIGDVCYAEAAQKAKAITPVPGGVGPMTIACLLANTVKATRLQNGLAVANLNGLSK